MPRRSILPAGLIIALVAGAATLAQQAITPVAPQTAASAGAPPGMPRSAPVSRLPPHVFDAMPPTSRVTGEPGQMTIRPSACRALPLTRARQRIVDLAVQEWGFFGFPIVEYDVDDETPDRPVGRAGGAGPTPNDWQMRRGRGPGRVGTPEAARTAATIGGYWAVTAGGAWILQNQNTYWREAISGVTRWRYPWSAAFISWLMCEGGIGSNDAFQRAIAHHTYIDQAIRARDGRAPASAYVAYDIGERPVAPGDMLCSARQPAYRTVADRRAQSGQGARTHCDVVVAVDDTSNQILAIGGNVRGVVGLKIMPASRVTGGLRPVRPPLFVHLQLRGATTVPNALAASPTWRAMACSTGGSADSSRVATLSRLFGGGAACGD